MNAQSQELFPEPDDPQRLEIPDLQESEYYSPLQAIKPYAFLEQFVLPQSDGEELVECPACYERLVQAHQEKENGNDYWAVELDCPDCGWCTTHLAVSEFRAQRLVMESIEAQRALKLELLSIRNLPDTSGENTEPELRCCEHCHSDLVQTVEAEELNDEYEELTVYCPECDTLKTDIYSIESVDKFLEIDTEATEVIVTVLKKLVKENREAENKNAEIEFQALARLISAGHVLPEDF